MAERREDTRRKIRERRKARTSEVGTVARKTLRDRGAKRVDRERRSHERERDGERWYSERTLPVRIYKPKLIYM
jgi:hypothetical protein